MDIWRSNTAEEPFAERTVNGQAAEMAEFEMASEGQA
jgi:hypothetical protein